MSGTLIAGVVASLPLACGLAREGLAPDGADAAPDAPGERATSADASTGAEATATSDASGTDAGPDAVADGVAGCDANLSEDPAHCGRCDRDCAGGSCVAGACTPASILTGADPIRAMGVTDTYLVWATNGTPALHRASLDGGGAQVIEALSSGVSELTVAGGSIYYTTGDLHVVNLDGSGDHVLLYGSANACVQVSGTTAYLANGGSPPGIDAFDIATGTRTPIVPPQDLVAPWGVAASAGAVYWSGNQHGAPDGGIWQLALDGSTPNEIVPHLANPNCITVYDGALWWPDSDDGTIMTSDLSGQGAHVLATGQDLANPPTTVAVDARFVYWHSGAKIMRLAR